MPTLSESNMFRRLVGDYTARNLNDVEITSWLDDACEELTSDFVDTTGAPAPVIDFDTLVQQYKPEIIYKAAINYWWSRAAELAEKLSTSVGQASQQASDRYTNAMNMVRELETYYNEIQSLGIDITIGNLSYFNKQTLSRMGGEAEEKKRDLF